LKSDVAYWAPNIASVSTYKVRSEEQDGNPLVIGDGYTILERRSDESDDNPLGGIVFTGRDTIVEDVYINPFGGH
jgi:hypothetical protein